LENKIFDRISNLIQREKIGLRRKGLIFSFFLLIAFFIWFLKALEKNYSTVIDYPVRYRDLPENKALLGDVTDHLELTVNAHGYVLLQHRISSRYIPLVISLESFRLNNFGSNQSGFSYLETRYLNEYIQNQLGSDFEILDVSPDTLVFPFAELVKKNLPVRADLDFQLDQQIILKGNYLLEPDTVEVTGPDYLLDTMQEVVTRHKDLGLIAESDKYDLIPLLPSSVRSRPETIRASLEVEKFTEKTMNVPVTMMNVPDSLRVLTFPQHVSLTCRVGLSNYEKLQAAAFRVVVDYNQIRQEENRLPINLGRVPEYVQSVSFTPKTVEYLIEKND